MESESGVSALHWRERLRKVIFEADTPGGRAFDVVLIISILASVAAVMIESIGPVREAHGRALVAVEWFFTILFTIEYALRLICVGRPARYATSFFGLVDLCAVLPTYLSLLVPGTHYMIVIRIREHNLRGLSP